jgi:predicted phosphodiesterase
MKLQLLSDLHLESHPHFAPTPAPGADLLVLAGDIGSYQQGSMLSEADFGLQRFSPLQGWPTPVLFVPGNHEYDGLDFDEAHRRLQATCTQLDICFLEQSSITAHELLGAKLSREALGHNIRFVGTTLWTDFDALNPKHDPALRHKAFRAANYHLRKTAATRGGEPFLAELMRDQALSSQAWLRQALSEPFEGTTVVITHYAPSLLSMDPRYGLVPGTAGFCNALDDLFPQAALWLHGHLHCPHDYVQAGCRVVSNPMGYARKQEQDRFNPTLCIEVA